MGKTLMKEKQYNILFYDYNYLIKNFVSETQWNKT